MSPHFPTMRFSVPAVGFVLFLAGCAASGAASGDPAGPGSSGGATSSSGDVPTATGDGFGDQLCSGGFCWVSPRLGSNTLASVHAVADGEDEVVFAVGGGGAVLRGRSDGWRVASTPTAAAFFAVFAIAKDDVWAVGEAGAIVHYDGKGFRLVDAPVTSTLRGVWAAASDDVWAVGDEGIAIHWDGKAWTQRGRCGDEMHAVWGAGPDDVWFVGGTLNVNTIAHWNGDALETSHGDLSGEGLYAIHGRAADDIWAAGEYGHVLHYDGKGWRLAGRVANQGILQSVQVTPSGAVWVGDAKAAWKMKSASAFELAPWTVKDGPSVTALGLASAADGGVWMVGAGGVVRQVAADGGSYRDELGDGALVTVALIDDRHAAGVFAVGAKGASARVFDGTAWTEMASIPDAGNASLTVGMTNDGTAIVMERTYVPTETSVVSVYEGGKLRALPAVKTSVLDAITGKSASDFYVGMNHWNGASWRPVTVGSGQTYGGIPAARATGADGTTWLVGTTQVDNRSVGWLGHIVGETYTGAVAPVPDGFTPTSVAPIGDGAVFVAGMHTDYSKPQDRGFVYYPRKPLVYRVKGDSWKEQELPGVTPDYDAVSSPAIGANAERAYVAFIGTKGVAANGYAFDGKTWTPTGFPATNVHAVTVTANATWIAAEGLLRTK